MGHYLRGEARWEEDRTSHAQAAGAGEKLDPLSAGAYDELCEPARVREPVFAAG